MIHPYRRNYRRQLMDGIRARIEREKFGRRLIDLYHWLFDAAELPA